MEPIAIVAGLAVLQVFLFAFQVGQQRVMHGIKAPATTGHPEFERAFRVQQNTVELLVAFLPGLFLFGFYVNALIGSAIGLVFIVGRFIYRTAYMRDPKRRSVGFGLSAVATLVLVLGGMIGAVISLL